MRTNKSKILGAFALLFTFMFIACTGGPSNPPPPPPPSTYSISGTVTGATGVTATLTPGNISVSVSSNGSFTFANLTNGSYTVTTTLAGYTFSPSSHNVTVNNGNVVSVDFVATAIPPATYSISGAVSGATAVGVTMTLNPGNMITQTAADGTYHFAGLVSSIFIVTPSFPGVVFTPTSLNVTVNNVDVTGINFTDVIPPPVLKTGKLMYIGTSPAGYRDIYAVDLSTGSYSGRYGDTPGIIIDTIVSYRGVNQKVAYRIAGSIWPTDGVFTLDMSAGAITSAIPVQGVVAPGYPSTTYGSFDIGSAGDYAVVTLRSDQGKKDIFLLLTNGIIYYAQVTTDGVNTSPVIATTGDFSLASTMLFLKNGNEVWKQDIPASGPLTAPATLFASSAMDSTRPMSVNADYTKLAYMKNVGGVSHIVVIPLAGGTELDLGHGYDPSWSFTGNQILFHTDATTLWVINADGTNKMSVSLPSNMVGGTIANVVFAPLGY